MKIYCNEMVYGDNGISTGDVTRYEFMNWCFWGMKFQSHVEWSGESRASETTATRTARSKWRVECFYWWFLLWHPTSTHGFPYPSILLNPWLRLILVLSLEIIRISCDSLNPLEFKLDNWWRVLSRSSRQLMPLFCTLQNHGLKLQASFIVAKLRSPLGRSSNAKIQTLFIDIFFIKRLALWLIHCCLWLVLVRLIIKHHSYFQNCCFHAKYANVQILDCAFINESLDKEAQKDGRYRHRDIIIHFRICWQRFNKSTKNTNNKSPKIRHISSIP